MLIGGVLGRLLDLTAGGFLDVAHAAAPRTADSGAGDAAGQPGDRLEAGALSGLARGLGGDTTAQGGEPGAGEGAGRRQHHAGADRAAGELADRGGELTGRGCGT